MKTTNNNNENNNKKMNKNIFSIFGILGVLLLLASHTASASLKLDNVQFDPAIIASGDEVDIIVQFHDEALPFEESKIGDSDYTFKVELESDDDITREYVQILDSEGDELHGRIYANGVYNKVFRVKVANDAPAASYEFRLNGIWYKEGEPVDSIRFLRFKMPVKKEGIILELDSIITEPAEVRPGDDFVAIKTSIANVGEKDAKSIEIELTLPDGIESSYSNNNRVYIGRLNAGDSQEIISYVNIAEEMGTHDSDKGLKEIGYSFEYLDLDNNKYSSSKNIPFLIKNRPYIEVIKSEGSVLAGDTGILEVHVKNTGRESAESVDVRVIKQNSQPFDIDVRSDYIGELEPGEEGVALFSIKAQSDAPLKEHDFKVLIRAKGDSDDGDDNIYTFNRRAKYSVTGIAENKLADYGLIGVIVVVSLLLIQAIFNKISKSKKQKEKKK